MTSTRISRALVLSLFVGGCSFDVSGVADSPDSSIDGPVPIDGPVVDGPMVDAAMVDAQLIDAMIPIDAAPPTGPVVVSYWRMESEANPLGSLDTPNEVAGGLPVTGGVDPYISSNVPVAVIPKTMQVNVGSLARFALELNAAAAYDPRLDVSSIGVEFWARTTEASAIIFDRSRDISTDGVRIDNPNNVRVRYVVDDGAGGGTLVTMITGHDMDDIWHHYAFTYDEVLGVGCFYVDGVLQGTCEDGPDNRPLYWGTDTPVEIGLQMDGAGLNAVIDEVRVWDGAPAVADFLISPP